MDCDVLDGQEWTLLHDSTSRISTPIAAESLNHAGDHEMWTSVYNLLHEKPDKEVPFDDDDSSKRVPKTKRIRVYTNNAEVQQLEDEIQALEAKLDESKRADESRSNVSAWERAARHQRVLKNKSVEENQQLQIAIRERNHHIERLQKHVLQLPRWTAYPGEMIQEASHCIPADPVRRIAALHRLVDQFYSRLQTTFIQAGAFNLRQAVTKCEQVDLPHNQLGFRFVHHMTIPASSQLLARECWKAMYTPLQPIRHLETETASWERVDERTVYTTYSARLGSITSHSNIVRKFYEEPNRSVIAWTTTTEDALVIRQPTDIMHDSKSFWQFTPHPDDPETTSVTMVAHANLSVHLEHKDMKHFQPAQVMAAMEQLFVVQKNKSQPDDTIPIFEPFIQRSHRLKERVVHAVKQVLGSRKYLKDAPDHAKI
ncbi:unnamed protein product [Aphanomyces euteiches]